jgi:hypothetical protein
MQVLIVKHAHYSLWAVPLAPAGGPRSERLVDGNDFVGRMQGAGAY